jgi:hypothetical protein
MNDLDNPKYCVLLKAGIPSRELQFFEHFCFKIISPQEEPLLYFRCSEIDVSHHSYIEMKIFHPSSELIWPLMVPHQYILSIDGADDRKSIGFYANQ